MSYINTEEMSRAANRMNQAADEINKAVNNMQGIIDQQARILDRQEQVLGDFNMRFEATVNNFLTELKEFLS